MTGRQEGSSSIWPVLGWLRRQLLEPGLDSLDPDSVEYSVAHLRILRRKPMVRDLFTSFYDDCRSMDERFFGRSSGVRLEIGSGSSFMKDLYTDVVTSDIKCLPFVDLVCRGEEIPFSSSSVRAIYGINAFHHLQRPRDFLRELLRVLSPGGGVVLIEPYHGWLARVLFRRLHAFEGFDPDVASWESPTAKGPLSNANQALSLIVFRRDVSRFRQEFPNLEIVLDRPHTHLQYLLSGGVNFRQLVPTVLAGPVKSCERFLRPLDTWLALLHTIVLRKRA